MKKIIVFLTILGLIVALVLMGCAQPAPAPSPTPSPTPSPAPAPKPPIKIGVMYSLSGPIQVVCAQMVDGAKFACEELNYEFEGRKIELIVEDCGMEANEAIDKAKKFVEYDKVDAVIGPIFSWQSIAVGDYLSQAKVVHLQTHIVPKEMVKYPWSFKMGLHVQESSSMGLYAYDEMKLRNLIINAEDTAAGYSVVDDGLVNVFKRKGGTIVQEQRTPYPCTDFGPFFSTLKSADGMASYHSGIDAMTFLTQFYEFGVDKKMVLLPGIHGAFIDEDVMKALPPKVSEAMIGLKFPNMFTDRLDNDACKKFVEAFKESRGIIPGNNQDSPYVAVHVLLEALKANGFDTTPDKLRQAILGLKMETPDGPLSFDPETQVAIRDYYIVKVDKIGEQWTFPLVYTYKDVPPLGW